MKFGFSVKKKRKKSKAEQWQESGNVPPKPAPYQKTVVEESPSSSSSSTTTPYKESTVERINSQNSHDGYDPFNADTYIPASRRRSQFDQSVLDRRQSDNTLNRDRVTTYDYDTIYDYKRQSHVMRPAQLDTETSDDSSYIPVRDRIATRGSGRQSSTSPYITPSAPPQQYPSGLTSNNGLYPSSSEEDPEDYGRRNKYQDDGPAWYQREPALSDIQEGRERHFTQTEWKSSEQRGGRAGKKGAGKGYGGKITDLWDEVAEGISNTLSRIVNSAKLFCTTCFWSRNSN